MKKDIYIETSIISYLTAKPTRNLLTSAWQNVTIEWWEKEKNNYNLYISEVVKEEASRGNIDASKRRLKVISKVPILSITDEVVKLSELLIKNKAIPKKAIDDALHIALSSIHNIDYLLTWNFRHIDNANIKPLIRSICLSNGFNYPEICTPQELLGGKIYER